MTRLYQWLSNSHPIIKKKFLLGALCGLLPTFQSLAHTDFAHWPASDNCEEVRNWAAPTVDPISDVYITENNAAGVIATASGSDSDGDNLTYILSVNPTSTAQYFSIDASTGVISATTLDYEELFGLTTTSPLSITLTVTVSDGSATDNTSFSVFVENVDDLPYTIGDASGNISLNGSTSIGQSFTTADAGTLSEFEINVVTPPSTGIMTIQVWKDSDLNPTASFTGPGIVETDLVYEQQVEVTNSGVQDIVLPAGGAALEANTVYTVEMFGTSMFLRYAFPATYSRGRILWSNNLFGCCDLHFVATIDEGSGALGGLISPRNGENIPNTNDYITFEWEELEAGRAGRNADEDVEYILHIRTTGEPEIEIDGITETFYNYPVPSLSLGTVYEWFVEVDGVGETEILRFRTPDVYIGGDDGGVVTGLTDPLLAKPLGVQPNPFVSEVAIDYTLREFGDVSVEVYDLRGVLVKELPIQSNVLEGSFQWDGTDSEGNIQSKGMYLFKMNIWNDGNLATSLTGRVIKN